MIRGHLLDAQIVCLRGGVFMVIGDNRSKQRISKDHSSETTKKEETKKERKNGRLKGRHVPVLSWPTTSKHLLRRLLDNLARAR